MVAPRAPRRHEDPRSLERSRATPTSRHVRARADDSFATGLPRRSSRSLPRCDIGITGSGSTAVGDRAHEWMMTFSFEEGSIVPTLLVHRGQIELLPRLFGYHPAEVPRSECSATGPACKYQCSGRRRKIAMRADY